MHTVFRTVITSTECQKFPKRCKKEKFYSWFEQLAKHGDTVSGGKPKVLSTETRGRPSFIEKVFAQFPTCGPFYINEVFKMHISDWSELCSSDCLVSRALIGWLKKANEDVMVQFWLDEPSLSPLITRGDQELPYNGWLNQREQYRSSLWLFLKYKVHEILDSNSC